jgi:O-antigen/teichoic acid export membrane protein
MLMKTALWSGDAQNRIAWNIWIALGVLTVASYLLIEKQAYLGAAIALVIGESSFFVMNCIAVRRKGLPMGRSMVKPVAAGLGMIAAALALYYMAGDKLSSINISILAALVYILIILAIGFFTKTDRAMIRDAISRRKS